MDQSKARARRCAIYTRKSSEEGLEQDFNSLQAQREACEAFIKSQASEGWKLIKTAYDDGGMSGGTMERPALQRLLADIGERLVDVVVPIEVVVLNCWVTGLQGRRENRRKRHLDGPSSRGIGGNFRQQSARRRSQAAERLLLNPIGDRASQQITTDAGWWLGAIEHTPAALEICESCFS